MNPNHGDFPPRWLLKMLGYYTREEITEDSFLDEVLTTFDPDSAVELCGVLPPSIIERLRSEFASSPATEEAWRALAEGAQQRGTALRESVGDHRPTLAECFVMGDHDGYWEFGHGVPLRRCSVYVLRQALGLPTHEEPWEVWYDRHAKELLNCSLHPWVLANRAHWYRYLDSAGRPFGGPNEFASAPDQDSEILRLHREMDFLIPTIEQVRFRADFVSRTYPDYFFNARYRFQKLVRQREFIANQLDCIGRFLPSRPDTLSRVFAEHRRGTIVSIGGTVSKETDLIPLREFLRTTFRELVLEQFPNKSDDYLDYMVDVTVEKE